MSNARFSDHVTKRRVGAALLAILLLAVYVSKDALFLFVLRKQLKKVPNIAIGVGAAHLGLWPAGVAFDDVEVVRCGDAGRSGAAGEPLTLVRVTHVQTHWKWWQLLRGVVAADAAVQGAEINIWRVPAVGKPRALGKPGPGGTEVVPGPPEPETILVNWPMIARFIVPVAIDEASVQDAKLWIHDTTVSPQLHWPIESISAKAQNLTNRRRLTDGQYASVEADAKPAKGRFRLNMQLDPLAKTPTFALRASMTGVSLPELNKVLMAYAHFDTETGSANAEISVACQNGKYDGFVEPRIESLKVRGRAQDKEKDTFLNRAYRTLVRAVSSVVEDSKEQAIATKVPLRGEFVDPEIGVWQAVSTLLVNAWWESLTPSTSLPKGQLPALRGSLGPNESARKAAKSPSKPQKNPSKKRKTRE